MKRDFTQLKEEFTKWYGLSEKERLSRGLPKDIPNFALVNDVSRQTIYNWIGDISDNGETSEAFDPKNYIDANLEKLLKKLINVAAGEKGTAKHLELALKIAGLLVEKREEVHKFELTPDDRVRIARETLDGLREHYQRTGGFCPVCRRPEIICDRPLLDTEPEQSEDREVATVAVPARPD